MIKKKNKLIVVFVTVLLCLTMATLLVSCNLPKKIADDSIGAGLFKQPSSTKIIGETQRQKPEVKDGGLAAYPSYTNTVNDLAQKMAISAENGAFFGYDKIDSYGNLYTAVKDDKGIISYTQNGGKLFKHSGADGMYQESVEDNAQAVVAKVHMKPSRYGNNLTELYIPAGEVVTVIIDDNLVAKGGLVVNIGFGVQRGGSVVIPETRDFTRFPSTRKTMTLSENINYIGSPLGGSLYFMSEYLMNQDQDIEYDVTVIGAVKSPQYYFGATTDAEWEQSKTAPGIFFHMEMRSGIRLTMPAVFARNKSAEEMRLLGQFYENTANISNKLSGGPWYSNHPVDCTFDSYVPAGAAVAFVGADFCCNPTSWAAGALDYYGTTTNGNWGVLHEFNHHHQGWGAGAGDEVTNNVANFLTYALNTDIGAFRRLGATPDSWNWVADAYLSNKETKKQYDGGNRNRSLSVYVDLGHAFGEEFMYKLAASTPVHKKVVNGENVEDNERNMDQFYLQTSVISGYDMTYYLQTVNHFELSDKVVSEVKTLNLPMYVPIASPYQTAIAMNGADFIQMGKPYYVTVGGGEVIDFSNFIEMPNVIISGIQMDKSGVRGKLEPVEGKNAFTFNYTPIADSGVNDVVILTIDRQLEGGVPIPTVKIRIELAADYAYATGTVYNNSGFANIDDAISGNIGGLEVATTISNIYGSISTNTANTIAMLEGKMVLPKGLNTLAIKGDDQVKLVVTSGDKELVADLRSAKGYDYSDKSTIINIESDGTPLAFKLYMLNTGGKGSANIGRVQGYSADGVPNIVNIQSKYLRNVNYDGSQQTKGNYIQEAGSVGQYFGEAKIDDMGDNAKVALAPQHYGNSVAQFAVDGNRQTFYHSKTGLAFPAEIVIDYGRVIKFNNINILPRRDINNGAGRIKNYQLWAGKSPTDLTLIGQGEGDNSYDGFNVGVPLDAEVPIAEARYVKIIVSSVWGQGYIGISEVTPSIALKSNAVVLSNSNYYRYKGDWSRTPYGSSVNGEVRSATKGSATIRFKGTSFAIVGNKDFNLGTAKVYVDGKVYGEMNCYADKAQYEKPLMVVVGLKDKLHNIEIFANGDQPINFNYMIFDVDKSVPYWDGTNIMLGTMDAKTTKTIIICASVGGILLLGGAVALGVFFWLKSKRTVKNKFNDKLDKVVVLGGGKELATYNEEPTVMKPIITKRPPKKVVAPEVTVFNAPMKPIKIDENVKTKSKESAITPKVAVAEPKPKAVKEPKAKASAIEPKAVEKAVVVAPKVVKEPKLKTSVAEPKAVEKAVVVAPKVVKEPKTKTSVAEPKAVEKAVVVAPKAVKEPKPKTSVAEPKAVEKAVVVAPKAVKEPKAKASVAEPKATEKAVVVAPKAVKAPKAKASVAEPKAVEKAVVVDMPKPILHNVKNKPTTNATTKGKQSTPTSKKGGNDEKK